MKTITTVLVNPKSFSPSCDEQRCSATVAMSEVFTEAMVVASASYRAVEPTGCAMPQRMSFSRR